MAVSGQHQTPRAFSIRRPWFLRTHMRRIATVAVLIFVLVFSSIAAMYRSQQPAAALSSPTISSLSTTSGPTIGGTRVSITGTGFSAGQNFTKVTTGTTVTGTTCGITVGGKAYCWGNNTYGQIGDASTTRRTSPTAVDTSGVLSGKTIVDIATTGMHTCAVDSAGAAYCWGSNLTGQLGDNSTTQRNSPVAVNTAGVLSGKTVTQIVVGGGMSNASTTAFGHTCAIDNAGAAYCWGNNQAGQLGDNSTTQRNTPVAVDTSGVLGGKTVTQISTSAGAPTVGFPYSPKSGHTCVIASGAVYCWGSNLSGQLGDNSTTQRNTPVAVNTAGVLSGKTMTQVSATDSVYVDIGNATYQYGHTCAIDNAGVAYCWGYNVAGQLGDGTTTQRNTPVAVSTTGVLSGKTVTQIETGGGSSSASGSFPAGYGQTCAVADGAAFCWGYNGQGQLGDNSTTNRSSPVAVYTSGALSGKTITQVSTGYGNALGTSCALDSDGSSYCWGSNSQGQYGNGTTTGGNVPAATTLSGLPGVLPTVTFGGTAATAVTFTSSTQLDVTTPAHTDGAVNVVVTNYDNQAATLTSGFTYIGPSAVSNKGPTDGKTRVTITGVGFTGGQMFKQISAGMGHSCGVTADGKVYCWGYNGYGQLGDNSTTNRSTPVAVNTSGVLSGKTVVSVSAGGGYTCAVTSDGGVYCWGVNGYGQLGDNSTTTRTTPVAVSTAGVLSGKTVTSVSAGGQLINSAVLGHTCAITSDGSTYCWGYNGSGQLGDNSTTTRYVPVAVNTAGVLSGKTINQISAGAVHTCAVDTAGVGYCWGDNATGQVGDSSTTSRTTPVAITTSGVLSGLTITQLDAGAYHTCVVASDAKPYCWGDNRGGQIGDNSTTVRSAPVAVNTAGVLAGKTITQVSAGGQWLAISGGQYEHTCALTSDNQAYCWGYNATGQLGDGTTTQRNTPVAVSTSGVLNGRKIVQISAGGIYTGLADASHTCALTDNGQTFCWGNNSYYSQIGDGTSTNRPSPTTVLYTNLPTTAPSVTFGGTAATDVTYLSPTTLQATTPAKSAGAVNLTVTSPDGLQTASSTNAFTYVAPYASPTLSSVTPNSGLTAGGTSVTLSGTNLAETAAFTSVSAGQDNAGNSGHSCGVTADGRAYCWGLNGDGQLGDGTTTRSLTPVRVRGALLSKTVVQITTGGNDTCALTADNLLYCWGDGNNGKLGNNATSDSSTPVSVTQSGVLNGKTIRSVSAAADDVCAVATDNTAACWGYNGSGRLGNNSTTASSVPVTVSGSHSFISVTPGQQTTCGVRTDFTAYCWGDNSDGAVGDNSVTNRLVPTAVNTSSLLASLPIIQTTVKNAASCGLAYTGKAYCWGGGWDYGLGNGSTAQSNVPVAVSMSGLTATSLVAGFSSPCILTTSSAVYCWGDNTYGQHGTGNTTTHTTPTQMDTASLLSGKTIANISTASTQTCVVTTDQITACTGYNTDGALGNNSTTNSTSLVLTRNYVLPSSVTFGGTAATGLAYVDQNTVTAATPAHAAGAVNVVLTRQDTSASTLTNGYTYVAPATVPDAPTSLTTTPANNSVILNWTVPSNNGGSAITDYAVEYSDNGGGSWSTFPHTASTSTTQTVTGLIGGTTYTFRVKAVNAVGTGAASNTATSQTLFITLTSSGTVGFTVTPDASGKVSSASSTATVNTNNPAGYTLQLSMNTASRDLASGGNTITPTSGTLASPGALGTNTWGYRIDGAGGFGAGPTTSESNIASSAFSWAMVPAQGAPDNIKITGSPATNDITTIWYAMKANSTRPSGTYTNTVLYTAVTN